jgi:hypothetical protein
MTQKRWTLAEIRKANTEAGFYFFSRATMKAFGDTMKSFKVVHLRGKVFIERRREPAKAPKGGRSYIGDIRQFNPETGDISCTLTGERFAAALNGAQYV